MRFRVVIGIAGLAAEIDGVVLAHHRFSKIGHAFGAAYRHGLCPQATLPPLMRVVSLAFAARPQAQAFPLASLQV